MNLSEKGHFYSKIAKVSILLLFCAVARTNIYAFSSHLNYKHNSPPKKNAAMPELCLLGKNRTNHKLE